MPTVNPNVFICSGVIRLRDLLSFSPIDILVKSADQKSYHAILQELKDKEVYNVIVDIHNTENMSDFLKAVRLINDSLVELEINNLSTALPDPRTSDECL